MQERKDDNKEGSAETDDYFGHAQRGKAETYRAMKSGSFVRPRSQGRSSVEPSGLVFADFFLLVEAYMID